MVRLWGHIEQRPSWRFNERPSSQSSSVARITWIANFTVSQDSWQIGVRVELGELYRSIQKLVRPWHIPLPEWPKHQSAQFPLSRRASLLLGKLLVVAYPVAIELLTSQWLSRVLLHMSVNPLEFHFLLCTFCERKTEISLPRSYKTWCGAKVIFHHVLWQYDSHTVKDASKRS